VDRIILLVTSPRLPAGLLTAQAWDLVRAHPVFAAAPTDLSESLGIAGAAVTIGPADAATLLDAVARHGTVVWLGSPGGDEALAREVGLRLAARPGLAELELMYGSWDPPGARLLDVVVVMDRLVSPGGDPWLRSAVDDGAHGAHRALARYLLEEAYEAYDAISSHELNALREELGDVLLQVVLHARLAEEADPPWSVDDVAGGLVDKLVRRNPHVFDGATVEGVDEITDNWERIKREEKARDSAMDGIALAQPALALAAKILDRAKRARIAVPVTPAPLDADAPALGAALLALVAAAEERGLDAEGALRRAALALADAIRVAEAA
jgi:NTP pyrophosphatase (non-canonical NTP hydrolase)